MTRSFRRDYDAGIQGIRERWQAGEIRDTDVLWCVLNEIDHLPEAGRPGPVGDALVFMQDLHKTGKIGPCHAFKHMQKAAELLPTAQQESILVKAADFICGAFDANHVTNAQDTCELYDGLHRLPEELRHRVAGRAFLFFKTAFKNVDRSAQVNAFAFMVRTSNFMASDARTGAVNHIVSIVKSDFIEHGQGQHAYRISDGLLGFVAQLPPGSDEDMVCGVIDFWKESLAQGKFVEKLLPASVTSALLGSTETAAAPPILWALRYKLYEGLKQGFGRKYTNTTRIGIVLDDCLKALPEQRRQKAAEAATGLWIEANEKGIVNFFEIGFQIRSLLERLPPEHKLAPVQQAVDYCKQSFEKGRYDMTRLIFNALDLINGAPKEHRLALVRDIMKLEREVMARGALETATTHAGQWMARVLPREQRETVIGEDITVCIQSHREKRLSTWDALAGMYGMLYDLPAQAKKDKRLGSVAVMVRQFALASAVDNGLIPKKNSDGNKNLLCDVFRQVATNEGFGDDRVAVSAPVSGKPGDVCIVFKTVLNARREPLAVYGGDVQFSGKLRARLAKKHPRPDDPTRTACESFLETCEAA